MGAVFLLIALEAGADQCKISDLRRFPSHEQCETYIKTVDEHVQWVIRAKENALSSREWDDLNARHEALFHLRTVWVVMRDAHMLFEKDTRLEFLQQVRDAIGEEAYVAGQMPLLETLP